jgi:putative hydrolase of the HAD superfamily
MDLTIDKQTCLVFDLDDTLYKEVDFLKSAYKHISKLLLPYTGTDIYDYMVNLYQSGQSTLDVIKSEYNFPYSIEYLVHQYRFHKPTLQIPDLQSLLSKLKDTSGKMGLLTDGRSITQRNKIKALGIESFFDDIRISEETGFQKPAEECYTYFEMKYPYLHQFIYIADNIIKDFITPNKLGWYTVGLRMNQHNIHNQDMSLESSYHPKVWLEDLSDLYS